MTEANTKVGAGMTQQYCVGVDLGGTNIKAGLLDADGKVLSRLSLATAIEAGRDRVVQNIIFAAERAVSEAGVKREHVIGIEQTRFYVRPA